MNRLFSGNADLSKAGCALSDLLVDLDAIRDLCSGTSEFRDFIRHLPVHLSKYILSTQGCLGGFLMNPPITTQFGGSQVYLLFFQVCWIKTP